MEAQTVSQAKQKHRCYLVHPEIIHPGQHHLHNPARNKGEQKIASFFISKLCSNISRKASNRYDLPLL